MSAVPKVRRIAVTIGDPNGIGPEVALSACMKLCAAGLPAEWVLIGGGRTLDAESNAQGAPPPPELDESAPPQPAAIRRWTPPGAPDPKSAPGHVSVVAARAAHAWLIAAIDACRAGRFDALVTAPIAKAAFQRARLPATGHTEILARRCGAPAVGMLLMGGGLRVLLATRHLPLARVPRAITPALLREQIGLLWRALPWLGLPGPGRIAVAGLNPHAGDGGALGREEIDVIAPAVRAARRRGWGVVGPVAGDTVFHKALRGRHDAVVAMYHDQGLAALKTIAFEQGVNLTLGLPIVRVSPDHGTAFDIAGRGAADPSSMLAALTCALDLCARPNPWARR